MRRRGFIRLLAGAAGWPILVAAQQAAAQQSSRMRQVGLLMGYAESDPDARTLVRSFQNALATFGWTDGTNVRLELRWAGGDPGNAKSFARELVQLEPDVIVGQDTPVTEILSRETQTIPIVIAVCADPIGAGFVLDLTHPNRNITGFASNDSALGGKWVELLKEIVPDIRHAVVMFNPATASVFLRSYMDPIQRAASHLGIEVTVGEASDRASIDSIIAKEARNSAGSLIVLPDQSNTRNRDLIVALAGRYRLPAIYFNRLFVKAGGLISYGIDFTESYRQAAGYVDRILRGAKVAELPVQQPTKYELSINLNTAKALGVEVPALLQQVADEVIE